MASILKNCNIKNVLSRSYTAAVKPKPTITSAVAHEPCVTIENDIVIASLENNAPVSSIAISYKSGSRYETSKNHGVSYALRAFASFESTIASSFAVGRNFQQKGSNIVCESGREHMTYQFTSMREFMEENFVQLSSCATEHNFKHWQIDDNEDRLKYENKVLEDPSTIVLEMLHKAAYRNQSLGNGILMPEHRNGCYTPEELTKFMEDTHTNRRMAVVGLGVDHTELVNLVKNLRPNVGDGCSNGTEPSSFIGALDMREGNKSPVAYVAVVGAGAKLGSQEAASLSVAANILSRDQATLNFPQSKNSLSKFSAAISGVGGNGSAVALNINYSDTGLFGFFLVEETAKAGEATRAIVDTIKGLKVTEDDVRQAVVRMQSKILISTESYSSLIENMGMQALFLRNYTPPQDNSAMNNVTAASVQAALASMLKSKPCLAAYGGIENVPYYDQL